MKRIVFLNTSIVTTEGFFSYEKTTLENVKETISGAGDNILSAIGHQSTADILTELTGIEVPVNRIMYEQEKNDLAIVFKLRGRPEEGKILSREEIEEIGYDFFYLRKFTKSDLEMYFSLSSTLSRSDCAAEDKYSKEKINS